MPNPSSFKTKKDFMASCVKQVINEGKKPDQAVAQCNSIWSDRKSEGRLEKIVSFIKERMKK